MGSVCTLLGRISDVTALKAPSVQEFARTAAARRCVCEAHSRKAGKHARGEGRRNVGERAAVHRVGWCEEEGHGEADGERPSEVVVVDEDAICRGVSVRFFIFYFILKLHLELTAVPQRRTEARLRTSPTRASEARQQLHVQNARFTFPASPSSRDPDALSVTFAHRSATASIPLARSRARSTGHSFVVRMRPGRMYYTVQRAVCEGRARSVRAARTGLPGSHGVLARASTRAFAAHRCKQRGFQRGWRRVEAAPEHMVREYRLFAVLWLIVRNIF